MATTPNSTPTDLEFIGHIVNDKLADQPWYAKIANTLTAIIGAVVTIAGGALSLGLNLPDWAMLAVITVTGLGTVLGVRGTHNGFSESQRRKLDQWKAEYIDARHAHDQDARPAAGEEEEYVGKRRAPDNPARELTDSVNQFLADRRR